MDDIKVCVVEVDLFVNKTRKFFHIWNEAIVTMSWLQLRMDWSFKNVTTSLPVIWSTLPIWENSFTRRKFVKLYYWRYKMQCAKWSCFETFLWQIFEAWKIKLHFMRSGFLVHRVRLDKLSEQQRSLSTGVAENTNNFAKTILLL